MQNILVLHIVWVIFFITVLIFQRAAVLFYWLALVPKHPWCPTEDLKAKSPGQLPLLSVCLCSPVNQWFSFWADTLTGKRQRFADCNGWDTRKKLRWRMKKQGLPGPKWCLDMLVMPHTQSRGLCVKNLVSGSSLNFWYLCLYLQSK